MPNRTPGGLATVAAASLAALSLPATAERIVYLAEQDYVYVPELYLADLDRPGVSLKLNKDLPWFANGVTRFTLSPDGSKVVYSADQHIAPDAEIAVDADLYLVNITAPGVWTRLGGLPPGMIELFARFSPDGRRLAFTASDEFFASTQLYLVDLATPESATRMNGALATDGAVSHSGFEFTPDGSHLVYVAGELDRKFELYAVPLDEPGRSVRLNAPGGSVGDSWEGRFHILPDSRRVVYSAVWENPGQREVHVVSIDAPGQAATLNAPFNDGGYLYDFVVSPDGRHVAYVADAETDDLPEAWLTATDVPGIARKVNGAVHNSAGQLQFTNDGQYLVFAADGLRGVDDRDLFMAAVEGGTEAVRLSAPLADHTGVSRFGLSADGLQVAYSVAAADGFSRALAVARLDSPGAGIVIYEAPDDAAIDDYNPPQFGPDGERVAYIAVTSLARDVQDLLYASVSAPGAPVRINEPLTADGYFASLDPFRFLPAGAPPTGNLPENTPTPGGPRPKAGGGGAVGWLVLLVGGLLARRSARRAGRTG